MAEYIEREALQEALQRKKSGVADRRYTEGWNDCLLRVKSMVHSAKAADVAPVVHGRWDYHTHTMQECSVCKRHTARHRFNYCPNCGAKMKEGDKDAR